MLDARRAPHTELPSPADLFVGRDGELAAVARMLASAQTRLVTLTGPPGIGKTRLAVACASAYTERSGCAAVFVDLAPVRDPALVMVEFAQAVGVEPRGGIDLTGQLAAALGDEERLVVLDNCEHVLAAAPDVGQVLAACLPAAAGARYQPGAAPAVRRAGVSGSAARHARAGGCGRPRSPGGEPLGRAAAGSRTPDQPEL